MSAPTARPPRVHSTKPAIPRLENGDMLTRDEFERRYDAMPELRKAELIEGVVYMPSPVRWAEHAVEHADLIWFLNHYTAFTPGVQVGDNGTVRLDVDNEPQPDATMIELPEFGGRVRIVDGYLEGAPDLAAEVSASSVSIDLNLKFRVYRRNQVREYVVWRVQDEAIDWFIFRNSQFERLTHAAAGIYRSEAFPGLWLDAAALVRGDKPAVLHCLSQGLASQEHAAYVARLQQAAQSRP